MTWRVPADEAELAERLAATARSGRAGAGLVFTGAAGAAEADPAVRREVGARSLEVIATAAPPFRRVAAFEPRDQVVTVGAGTRLGALDETLAAEGQWLPAAAAAPGRSVGGLVAAAPAGPYDPAYGPVRRHLLACRTVSHGGEALRWGRPVVKDVAGYDMKGLWCGSRGRLGVLVEATFRTWPRPVARRRYRIRAGPGEPDARLGTEVARRTGREWFRPDALVWTWEPAAGAALTVELLGSAASVKEREEGLLRWAEGGKAEVDPEPEAPPEPEGPREALAGSPPRPAEVAVLAFRAEPGRLPELLTALRRAVEGAAIRLVAHPLAGTARLVYRRGAEPAERAGRLAAAAGPAAMAVERGGPEEHRAAEARRSPDARKLEQAVADALDARARQWVADYL